MTRPWTPWLLAAGLCALAAPATALTTAGFEADALPFATGGYYASGWIGESPWRARAVLTRTYPPDVAVGTGFNHLRLDVSALIVDRFIGDQADALAGPWLGAGVERWEGRIQEQGTGAAAKFSAWVGTFGGGYVWTFSGNWFLNPWAALHAIVDGDRSVPVGNHTYRLPPVTPEASVKLGWHF
jgi:hypothetical protein